MSMRKTLQIPHAPDLILPQGTVGLSFSTGADSTLLLYMLLDQTDLPVHLFQVVSRWLDCCELPIAANILNWFNVKFPGRSVIHTVRYADHADEMRDMLFTEPNRALYHNNTIYSFLTGLTKSPSVQIQAESFPLVLQGHSHLERDSEVTHSIRKAPSWYAPMNNLNKQQVYQLYEHYQIQDLWHLTRSCTQSAEPCGVCWWCTERAWAQE